MIKLFSEKVKPTFTNSDRNILQVENFEEVFFDVYEFEINGSKYPVEKISEYKGNPVVSIPVVVEDRKLLYPFVLQTGEFGVLFNENNREFEGIIGEEVVEESISLDGIAEDSIYDIVLEQKESILEEITRAKELAKQHIIETCKKYTRIADKNIQAKEDTIREAVSDAKESFLEQFLLLTKDIESRISTYNREDRENLHHHITEKIEALSSDLARDIKVNEDRAIAKFTKKIDELTTNVFTKILVEKIKAESEANKALIEEKTNEISASIKSLFESEKDLIKDTVTYLEKANIELNDKINKADRGVNKALSRSGNIKTQLEKRIEESANEIIDRMTLAEERINEYYNNRLNTITEHVDTITAKDREELIRLVENSRNSLSEEIANIKHHVPNIIIEKSNGKVKEINVKSIKEELEKGITSRFLNELSSLKRLIELSSGGGSVAVQYANGGVINGDLVITGSLSAGSFSGNSSVIPFYDKKLFKYNLEVGENNVITFPIQTEYNLIQSSFTLVFSTLTSKNTLKLDCVVNNGSVLDTGYAAMNSGSDLYSNITSILSGGYLVVTVNANNICQLTIVGEAIYEPGLDYEGTVMISENDSILVSENSDIFVFEN